MAPFQITEWPLHYVVFIQKHAQAAFSRALRSHGLTNQSWRVLAALSDGRRRTIGEIADLTVFDRANLGRTLDQMEREGLVVRAPSPEDRRAVSVEITIAGRARFEAAHPEVRDLYSRILDGFSAGEVGALMSGLRKLKKNCGRLTEDVA